MSALTSLFEKMAPRKCVSSPWIAQRHRPTLVKFSMEADVSLSPCLSNRSSNFPHDGELGLYINMDKFTASNLRIIRGEIDEAIKSVCDKHGITAKSELGRFSSNNHAFKIELKISSPISDEESRASEKLNFERCASAIGLNPNDFGREFVSGRDVLKVVGINTNRPANPVELERVKDGKRYKASAGMVKSCLHFTVGV